MRYKGEPQNRAGVTLVEIITVLVILAVMAAITVPSLLGFIDRVQMQQYVAEASSVRTSVQMLVTEEYAAGTLSEITTPLRLMDGTLDSPTHVLAPYLRTECSRGARLSGVTIRTVTGEVQEIVYEVAQYRITVDGEGARTEEIETGVESAP